MKQIADKITLPLTDIINSCIEKGQWLDIWKEEAVTTIPKVHPTISTDDLRNISGLVNQNKVTEKIFAELIISDMKEKLDKWKPERCLHTTLLGKIYRSIFKEP